MTGWYTSAELAVAPSPVTTLNTLGRNPTPRSSTANSREEAAAYSDGLTTTEQPAAIAGAHFHATKSSGEFQAVRAPTTPTGSQVVKAKWSGLSIGRTDPSSFSASPPL